MTEKRLECFHTTMYHQWYTNWQKDMDKHYSDKRRIIKKRFCK